jgi:hypothetical protein
MAGITPKEILDISEPIEAIYQNTVDELLINIARHFDITGWERTRYWEIKKLSEMGALTKESAAIIAANTKRLPSEVEKAFLEVANKACKDIDPQLRQAAEKGILQNPDNTPLTSVLMRSNIQAYIDNAVDTANMINTTMLASTQQAYARAVNTAVNAAMLEEAKQALEVASFEVVTGVETRTRAIRKAMNALVNTGIVGFYDKAGKGWHAEAYASMVIRTTAHNAAITAIKTRQEEYGGGDIFQVSSHPAARPLCYPYQGKFFSWSSSGEFKDGAGHTHKYDNINNSSYGEPAGLFGINCGHHPIPMIPNFSYPQDGPEMSEAENRKAYEESQKQRQYERDIREAKRDLEIAKATGDTDAIKAAEQKVAQKQANMRAYLKETGRPRRYDREKIAGTKDIDGFKGYMAQFGSDIPLAKQPKAAYTFTKASTREDAIKATEKYADTVRYTTGTLEQINEVNETLDELTAKYPIDKYRLIEENNRMRAEGKASAFNLRLHLKEVQKVQSRAEAIAVIDRNKKYLTDTYGDNIPKKFKKQLKEWDEFLKYDRYTVTGANNIRGTILHEYGHTLSDQYFGMINGVRANKYANGPEARYRVSRVRRTFLNAKMNGDIYKISQYAATDMDEFFAEVFAMRELGEELPKYITDMLTEVLNGPVQKM